MKTLIKILLVILTCTVIIIAGGIFYITRGLSEGEILKIDSIKYISIKDGKYIGDYKNGRFSNEVEVDIKNGKISKIVALKTVLIERSDVTDKLFSEVIEKQDTDIDIVSGATVTSKAYLKSIEDAIIK